jgi:hypothetical protein
MSKPGKNPRNQLEQIESFEDHVDTLFKELELAIQWQRPSILLVSCESKSIRADVELVLKGRLIELGHELVRIPVNEKRFDIPLLLSRRKDRDQSVYSVRGLSLGGGKEGANAYRALNIRREYFVDYHIRAIFWLVKEEMIKLTRHAPDFWAFRHRVVEFDQPAGPDK